MPSAQDAFSLLMKRHLTPGLRLLGFKGGAQSYELPSDRCWVLLGIQRSMFNDSAHVRFTVNLTVADRQTWEELRSRFPNWPERPNPNRVYGPMIWQVRLSELLPNGDDHWWQVTPESDVSSVANELLELIRYVALPDMMRRASTNPA